MPTNPINPFPNGDPDFYPVWHGEECSTGQDPALSPCRGAIEMRATPTGVFPFCDKHYDELPF